MCVAFTVNNRVYYTLMIRSHVADEKQRIFITSKGSYYGSITAQPLITEKRPPDSSQVVDWRIGRIVQLPLITLNLLLARYECTPIITLTLVGLILLKN